MSRDLVAMIVTVEVDTDAWEANYHGEYDAETILDYVREQIEFSHAVRDGAIKSDIRVRFRRQPIEGTGN